MSEICWWFVLNRLLSRNNIFDPDFFLRSDDVLKFRIFWSRLVTVYKGLIENQVFHSFRSFVVQKQWFWSRFFLWSNNVLKFLIFWSRLVTVYKGLIENQKLWNTWFSINPLYTVTSLDQKIRNVKTLFDQRKKYGSKPLFLNNKRCFQRQPQKSWNLVLKVHILYKSFKR